MDWCQAYYESQEREAMAGKDLEFARRTGQFRGHASIQGQDPVSGGVVLRIDSVVYPEAWMEVRLTPKEVREMYALLE
jgi:hypothetical protein